GDEEDRAGDDQADQKARVLAGGDDRVGENQVHQPGDERADEGGADGPDAGVHHFAGVEVAQGTAQQQHADDRARDEAEAVGSTQQHHDESRLGGDERRDGDQRDLGDRDAGNDEGRG